MADCHKMLVRIVFPPFRYIPAQHRTARYQVLALERSHLADQTARELVVSRILYFIPSLIQIICDI
jgi:hypothetical protein